MTFNELARFFESIEKTSSRLTITELLAQLFKKLTPEEIEKTMYLLQGRVVPLYEKVEFGMAEKTVVKSVINAVHIEKKVFDTKYKKIGDIGLTVEELKHDSSSLLRMDLTILEVFESLERMAKSSGDKSQEVKINILADLIRSVDPLASRFLVRIPLGAMRLGFSDMTILDSLSWMIYGDKSLRPRIEAAYHVRPDLGYIGRIIKQKGIEGLQKVHPHLFTPVLMMRAERLSSAKEIMEKVGSCSIEPKYDGFRLQVHYDKKKGLVKLYSRNLEDVSFMYPDILEGVQKEIVAEEVILEGEAVGFNPKTKGYLPFQETVQRKRKYGINEKAKEIPLKLFVFEILYKDGENYLSMSQINRRKILQQTVKKANDESNTLLLAPDIIATDARQIEDYFDDTITKGLEGIMAKKKDGIYQPGARGWNWIKYKRSYSASNIDTIDCLVMGYDFGKGKRAGFGIGAFLAGVYDDKKDMFYTVAKIGTGLTDEEWKELKKRAQKLQTKEKPANYEVDKQMECDQWMKPAIVVEIRADEITRSPAHTAGRTLKQSKSGTATEVEVPGYALRFPRLERFRDDKRPEDATGFNEVEKMYLRSKK